MRHDNSRCPSGNTAIESFGLGPRCGVSIGCPFGPDDRDWSYEASNVIGGTK